MCCKPKDLDRLIPELMRSCDDDGESGRIKAMVEKNKQHAKNQKQADIIIAGPLFTSQCANANCGKTGRDFLMCPCQVVWYCSEECQIAHWSVHKTTCYLKKNPGSAKVVCWLPAGLWSTQCNTDRNYAWYITSNFIGSIWSNNYHYSNFSTHRLGRFRVSLFEYREHTNPQHDSPLLCFYGYDDVFVAVSVRVACRRPRRKASVWLRRRRRYV